MAFLRVSVLVLFVGVVALVAAQDGTKKCETGPEVPKWPQGKFCPNECYKKRADGKLVGNGCRSLE